MTVTITAFRVVNFKRAREIEITLDGAANTNRRLYVIGGNNAQGKSSVLDALTSAFGGKPTYPPDPVHHGAARAEIVVELDGEVEGISGRFAIRRTITPDGGGKLEIRGPAGLITPAQEWLTKLVGARFLNPLAFLDGDTPADKRRRRAQLLKVAGIDTDAIDAERKSIEAERVIAFREAGRAKGEYERLPETGEAPAAARAIGEVTAELATTEAELRDVGLARVAHTNARRDRAAADQRVAELRAQLAAAETTAARAAEVERVAAAQVAERATGDHEQALQARLTALRVEAERSQTAARWAAGAEHARRRRTEAETAMRQAQGTYDGLTERLQALDARKATALAAASLPIAGLTFTDDGVMLNAVPFEQASQAERFRCAMAVAIRLSPNLRAVWVRDGSLLDDESLQLLADIAAEHGCDVIVERVGTRDPGVIVIHDGRIIDHAQG